MDCHKSHHNDILTSTRRRRRGSSRLSHVKRGRGRDRANCGTGIGGWKGRRNHDVMTQAFMSSLSNRSDLLQYDQGEVVAPSKCTESPMSMILLYCSFMKTTCTDCNDLQVVPCTTVTSNIATSDTCHNRCHEVPQLHLQGRATSSLSTEVCSVIASTNLSSPFINGSVFSQIVESINAQLPPHWICKSFEAGVNVFMMSEGNVKAIQRQLIMYSNGPREVFEHCKFFCNQELAKSLFGPNDEILPLTSENGPVFAKQVVGAVNKVNLMEVCVGVIDEELMFLWEVDSHGYTDLDAYQETRYTKSYRSKECLLLTPRSKFKCANCCKLRDILRKKANIHADGIKHHTSNIYLTEQEKLNKLQSQQVQLKRLKSKIK